jgi:hypothetical protein
MEEGMTLDDLLRAAVVRWPGRTVSAARHVWHSKSCPRADSWDLFVFGFGGSELVAAACQCASPEEALATVEARLCPSVVDGLTFSVDPERGRR